MIYSIYKITCLMNNKIYTGFTSKTIVQRWKEHYQTPRKTLISYAIKKYGHENFIVEIILQSKDQQYLLNEMEEYFIKKFNSHYLDGNGYNMTYGGEGRLGYQLSDITKEKIRKALLGQKHTKLRRKNISIAKKGSIPWNKGIKGAQHHGKEAKQKISVATSGKNNPMFGTKRPDMGAKLWRVTFPDGKIQVIKNLTKFCRENNLKFHHMYNMSTGKKSCYENFNCQKIG